MFPSTLSSQGKNSTHINFGEIFLNDLFLKVIFHTVVFVCFFRDLNCMHVGFLFLRILYVSIILALVFLKLF